MKIINPMIRFLMGVFLGGIGVISAMASDFPNMSCRFDAFIGVAHIRPSEAKKLSISQSLKIVKGKTDDSTLNLDGEKRAANSRQWMRLELGQRRGWDTWESSYIGDFREVLSLAHDLGANKKPLHGLYKASLISPGVETTTISIGECRLD